MISNYTDSSFTNNPKQNENLHFLREEMERIGNRAFPIKAIQFKRVPTDGVLLVSKNFADPDERTKHAVERLATEIIRRNFGAEFAQATATCVAARERYSRVVGGGGKALSA